MAQVGRFARSGRSFENRKSLTPHLEFVGKILMPLESSMGVMEAECFFAENGIGWEKDLFSVNPGSALLDEMERPVVRIRPRPAEVFGELQHEALGFRMSAGVAHNSTLIGTEKSSGAELKDEVLPFARSVFKTKLAVGADQAMRIFRGCSLQIP
jgi:hypothetical protein